MFSGIHTSPKFNQKKKKKKKAKVSMCMLERERERKGGGGVVSKERTYAIIYKYVGQDGY